MADYFEKLEQQRYPRVSAYEKLCQDLEQLNLQGLPYGKPMLSP
jgi:hypothetical protein